MAKEHPDWSSMTDNEILSNFQWWCDRYGKKISKADPYEAEDISQEAMIGMAGALKSYNPERGSLPSWLILGARGRVNRYLDNNSPTAEYSPGGHRKEKPPTPVGFCSSAGTSSGRQLDLDPFLEKNAMVSSRAINPADIIENRFVSEEVHKAVSELPDGQRLLVEHVYLNGLTWSTAPVKASWKSAKNSLAKKLAHLKEFA